MPNQASASRTPRIPNLPPKLIRDFYTVLLESEYKTESFQLAVEAFKQHGGTLEKIEMHGLVTVFPRMQAKLAVRADRTESAARRERDELLALVDRGLQGPLGAAGLCGIAMRICHSAELIEDISQVKQTCGELNSASLAKEIAKLVIVGVLADPTVTLDDIAKETLALQYHLDISLPRRR